jgi:hypothetical protein
VKCPRCLAVAMESDTVCVGCHQPLDRDEPSKKKKTMTMSLPAKLALAFTALGACLGLVVGYAFFPPPPAKPGASGGSNWPLFVGIGAGIGALVGYALGVLVFEKDGPRPELPREPVAQEAVSEEPSA